MHSTDDQTRLDHAATRLEVIGRAGEPVISTRCLLAASLLAQAGADIQPHRLAPLPTAAAIQDVLTHLGALSETAIRDERVVDATEHVLRAYAETR